MLFVVILFVVLLGYYIKLKYYTFHGPIPGLPPQFLFGNLIQSGILLGKVSRPDALLAFKARYGDVFQFWAGPTRVIVVSNINDVQHIFTHRHIYEQGDLTVQTFGVLFPDGLICNKGAKYKRHASIILSLFRRGKIISNLDLIIDNVDRLLTRWRRFDSTEHIHCDIVEQCKNLLLAIFGFIGFDYDLETLNEDNTTGNELTQALHEFLDIFNVLAYSPPMLARVYVQINPRYRQAKKIIERYLYRMMEQELNESVESISQRKRTCLIASLVASLQKNEAIEAKKSEEEKKGLSQKEVLDEMLLFLVAGFETTSSALAWFIYFMSKNPRVQHKIKAELMNDYGNTHALSLERLDSLIYLDCVIKEVLRLCPPVDGVTRTLTTDDCLPGSGSHLYRGDQVFIPFYVLAQDNRLWSVDPKQFYPERFLDEDKNHSPYAFIPFGGGHRQCIGQDLARFELKVVAARLMQYVTFGDGGAHINTGGYLARVTMMPKHVGVSIQFD